MDGLCSFLVSCLAWSNLASPGPVVGQTILQCQRHFLELLLSLPPHTSAGDPPTVAVKSGSVSCGITAPFLWFFMHTRFCVCPPGVQSLFSTVLWKFYNQIPRLQFPWEFLVPLPVSPGWEAWCGAQNLYNSGKTFLVLLFSSLWAAHL